MRQKSPEIRMIDTILVSYMKMLHFALTISIHLNASVFVLAESGLCTSISVCHCIGVAFSYVLR